MGKRHGERSSKRSALSLSLMHLGKWGLMVVFVLVRAAHTMAMEASKVDTRWDPLPYELAPRPCSYQVPI